MERSMGRLDCLQQQDLDPNDRKTVENIAKYGWHVIHGTTEGGNGPGWSYTVGLHHSYRHPEIIVTGLNPEAALFVLNECGRRVRQGATLANGLRQSELLRRVQCELRTADPFWVQELMEVARWFYDTWDFPALQCVHPDLENRFPWEQDFDMRFREKQPLLFADADWTPVEQRFLNARQPPDQQPAWNFPVSRFTGVYTSRLVHDGKEPIVYVSHDERDGGWQFHGTSDSSQQIPVCVCFHHLTDQDPSLFELADLPTGWCAWREAPGEPWKREAMPPEEGAAPSPPE